MALSAFVKVGAINNLSDARYCAGMEVNLIGFDLNPESGNYTSPEKFNEISEWLSGVDFVGECHNMTLEEIEKVTELYSLSHIEVNAIETAKRLVDLDINIILNISIDEDSTIPQIGKIDLLIASNSSDELTEDHKMIIKSWSKDYQVLLGSGISADNVEALLEGTKAHGINLLGGNEIRPGYKDYDELADVLEVLENDEY